MLQKLRPVTSVQLGMLAMFYRNFADKGISDCGPSQLQFYTFDLISLGWTFRASYLSLQRRLTVRTEQSCFLFPLTCKRNTATVLLRMKFVFSNLSGFVLIKPELN